MNLWKGGRSLWKQSFHRDFEDEFITDSRGIEASATGMIKVIYKCEEMWGLLAEQNGLRGNAVINIGNYEYFYKIWDNN